MTSGTEDSPAGGGRVGGVRWTRTNRFLAYCLIGALCALLVYLLSSDWTYWKQRDGFRLGYTPLFAVGVMFVCAASMLFDERRDEAVEGLDTISWPLLGVTILVLVGSFLFFRLAQVAGFLVAGPIYLGLLIYVFGLRPWWSAAVSGVILTVVVYAIFWAIGVQILPPLPPGLV